MNEQYGERVDRSQIHLILQLLKLDEEIKDFILKLDDSDPGLNFLSVYRLQQLFQVKSKERQRRKFWKMIAISRSERDRRTIRLLLR